jgi:hypothetical protein
MEKLELNELIEGVLTALATSGLSRATIISYKYSAFGHIRTFFDKRGVRFYCPTTSLAFREHIKKRLLNEEVSERYWRKLRKAVVWLEEYVRTGTVKWKTDRDHSRVELNENFSSILGAYLECLHNRLSSGTIKYVSSTIFKFLKFLENDGYVDFKEL